MQTKITTIAYNLDNEGDTSSITVTLAGYESQESLNATTFVTATDLAEGETLDDLSRKQIETLARGKIATYAKGVSGETEAQTA